MDAPPPLCKNVPDYDPTWVNTGEQNWLALRTEWKNYSPEDLQEALLISEQKSAAIGKADMKIICDRLLNRGERVRVPLPKLMEVLTDLWDDSS